VFSPPTFLYAFNSLSPVFANAMNLSALSVVLAVCLATPSFGAVGVLSFNRTVCPTLTSEDWEKTEDTGSSLGGLGVGIGDVGKQIGEGFAGAFSKRDSSAAGVRILFFSMFTGTSRSLENLCRASVISLARSRTILSLKKLRGCFLAVPPRSEYVHLKPLFFIFPLCDSQMDLFQDVTNEVGLDGLAKRDGVRFLLMNSQ
jgi:hypothetical protein